MKTCKTFTVKWELCNDNFLSIYKKYQNICTVKNVTQESFYFIVKSLFLYSLLIHLYTFQMSRNFLIKFYNRENHLLQIPASTSKNILDAIAISRSKMFLLHLERTRIKCSIFFNKIILHLKTVDSSYKLCLVSCENHLPFLYPQKFPIYRIVMNKTNCRYI